MFRDCGYLMKLEWLVGDKAGGIRPWIVSPRMLDLVWEQKGILSGVIWNE